MLVPPVSSLCLSATVLMLNELIAVKQRCLRGYPSLEIVQDILRTKFSALNVDFSSVCFDPLGSRSPPYEGINLGTSSKHAISATID